MSKIDIAIDRIREFCPDEGYYFCNSGGKDSGVVKRLVEMAGVPYDSYFHFTTVDPPEVISFIREYYPDVEFTRPEKTMWQLIVEKGPPTRRHKFCCEELKEYGGVGRTVLTGIRWEESQKRQKRQMVEFCIKGKGKRYIHPIIDWTWNDIWTFIRKEKLPYCSLYDEGFERIGCVMCAAASQKARLREAARWPKFYRAYLRAFERMLESKKERGVPCLFKDAQHVMDWWLEKRPYREEVDAPTQLWFSRFE